MNGNTVLPIWVGIYEANAIALEIEKVSTPRPMTHDLIKSLLFGLDTGIRKVVVNELKEDTFYAVIWLEREGELISVDSRPSDALALALRLDCPIFVDDTVLKSSKLAASVSDKVNNEELRRWLENLNDEDLAATRCRAGWQPFTDDESGGLEYSISRRNRRRITSSRATTASRWWSGAKDTIGSTGMMTEQGLAYLVWRDGQAFLKSKSAEIPATGEQLAGVAVLARPRPRAGLETASPRTSSADSADTPRPTTFSHGSSNTIRTSCSPAGASTRMKPAASL